MFRVKIQPKMEIGYGNGAQFDAGMLVDLLVSIEQTGSIAQGAKQVRLSYRYAWGMLRTAEQLFGGPLIQSGRGRGTRLSPLAEKLVWAERRITARLAPILESLASEVSGELSRAAASDHRPLRLDASHGFAVAALLSFIKAAQLPVAVRYRNSTDAVAALARGECDLAGFHVPLGQFEAEAAQRYAPWLDPDLHCLIHLATRRQGLFVASGNPKRIRGLQDLPRSDIRFVNRQEGSGTRMLLELMLVDAGVVPAAINGFGSAEFTHSAVAAYIASGMADVGFGVQAAATRFGLEFIPLAQERYFFALPLSALEQPLMRDVIAILQSSDYRDAVKAIDGYGSAATGTITSLAEAFGSFRRTGA